ncbi:hypothetical protein [Tropicimonas isoalkanivorans]|uniref:Uncharacterized protein n=1 Tax=Tropicimonas isoalkanivorans TaxID=441112 RepID=A0A1I1HWM4_9RHOB|nr:hypothetical protein [Tropicimonas isoalkanivorans]SFC28487.1 hypothetical protein SAMN04488094_103316 [Tropicimonas isoalkanivorans]
MAFVARDPALSEALKGFRNGEAAGLVAQATERGVADAQAIADAHREVIKNWRAIVAEIGEDDWDEAQWEAYREALRSEIYAQLSAD